MSAVPKRGAVAPRRERGLVLRRGAGGGGAEAAAALTTADAGLAPLTSACLLLEQVERGEGGAEEVCGRGGRRRGGGRGSTPKETKTASSDADDAI